MPEEKGRAEFPANRMAAVLYPSFRVPGGAEEYLVHLLRVLARQGYGADLYLVGRHGWRWLRETVPQVIKVIRVEAVETGTAYDIITKSLAAQRLLERIRGRYGLVVNAKASELLVPSDLCILHFPVMAAYRYGLRVAGVDPKYTDKPLWRLYILPFRAIGSKLATRLRECKAVVVNSRFTAIIAEKLAGIQNPVVVYPPIQIMLPRRNRKARKQSNLVLTISRFDPSKTLHKVLEIATKTPQAEFIIAGRASDPASMRCYTQLREAKKKLGLDNVHLLPNITSEQKQHLLEKAGIYLHPTIGEHLGIAVLEAILHGATPLVHYFSGACLDIVKPYSIGGCYKDVEEAAAMIKNLIARNTQSQREMKELIKEIYAKFSYEAFEQKIAEMIMRLAR